MPDSELAVHRDLADAVAGLAVQQGAAAPSVRGADWRQAIVASLGAGGLVTTTDGITARRLDTYGNPAVGDRIIITSNSQGSWLAAGRLAEDATSGEWTSYTPVWSTTGTNPSLGNGVLRGRYSKIGRTVNLHVNLDIGSTTTVGTGDTKFSLPFVAAVHGCTLIGSAQMLGGTGSRWPGQLLVGSGSTTCAPFFPRGTGDTRVDWLTSSLPEAFNSGDEVRMTITYESAT